LRQLPATRGAIRLLGHHGSTPNTRVAMPGRRRQFVRHRARKPSPKRHKNSTRPSNLQEQKELTLTRINTHPGNNASHESQPSGGAWGPKTPPHAPPDFERPPQPQETEELRTIQKNTHRPPVICASHLRPQPGLRCLLPTSPRSPKRNASGRQPLTPKAASTVWIESARQPSCTTLWHNPRREYSACESRKR